MIEPYYQDEFTTLYLGDCRELLTNITPPINLIFMDPPYGHNNNNGDLIHAREGALGFKGQGGDARPIANDSPEEASSLVQFLFSESSRLLDTGCCCCCGGGGGPDPQFARWSLWLDAAIGFKHMIVWDKGGLGMGWHYRRNYETVLIGQKPGRSCKWNGGNTTPNVLRINGIKPQADDHPTPKPVELPEFFIGLHTDPGDLVLDPVCGAGTTLVAAKNLGRRSIGIEIEERWCELAAKRLSQETISFNEKCVIEVNHQQILIEP